MRSSAGRFLAVDDNPDSAALASRVAERCGYETRSECDPSAVVGVVEAWRPDVISLDLCMPQMDGIELLKELIKCDFSGEIIFISGQTDALVQLAAKLAEAKGLSVIASLTKPIRVATLREKLTGAVQAAPDYCQAAAN